MRDDFCAIILTHGRPDRVTTYATLRRCGYTGPIFLLVDDMDASVDAYRSKYGAQVVVFDKRAAVAQTDDAGVSRDLRAVVYARNVVHDVVRGLGYRYFLMLDDDYREWKYTHLEGVGFARKDIRGSMDGIFDAVVNYLETIPALSIAFAQGGDFIGGADSGFLDSHRRRKVMNTFFCAVDRPFKFVGHINEDVNTYVALGARGDVFLSLSQIQVNQEQTQRATGGLTEIYLSLGTYVKSFISVLYAPSCVKVSTMGGGNGGRYLRIHHEIAWKHAVPQIIREKHRKTDPAAVNVEPRLVG